MAFRHDFVGRHQRKTQGTEQPSKQADWASILVLEVTVLAVVVPATAVALTWRVPVLQFAAAVILSSLPGFLYVRFVEFRGPSVWSEYVYNLPRLGVEKDKKKLPRTLEQCQTGQHNGDASTDPRDVNIYTQKFDAHFGGSNRRRWQRGQHEHQDKRRRPVLQQLDLLMPILVSSLVITLGWVVVFADPAFLVGGAPALVDQLRAGFLGSYVFVVQFLVRRYFQNDLKASAYYAVTERIIIVPIVVTILSVAMPTSDRADIAVAFVVGVFPVLGLRAINSLMSRRLRTTIPSLQSAYPLSDLDGMTIWYETRLIEEGIEDMQSLITANLVDLMLNTRIPVGRIVDWLDQAFLYIHLAPVDVPASRRGMPKSRGPEGVKENKSSDRALLRRYGIRCATDLEDAFSGYAEPNGTAPPRLTHDDRKDYYEGLKNLLKVDGCKLSVTLTVLNCLRREPNLEHVRNWKTLNRPAASASAAQAPQPSVN